MSPLRAVLLFPICPASAARALRGARGAAGILLGRPLRVRPYLVGCLVFAAWTVVSFPVLLAVLTAAGLGSGLALLAENAEGVSVLVRRGTEGRLAPVGGTVSGRGPRRVRGRVFFRFGGAWGGSVLRRQHLPPGSHRRGGGCGLPRSASVAYKGP